MNIWLGEHVDLLLGQKLVKDQEINILAHGAALGKLRTKRDSSIPQSPLCYLDDHEVLAYSKRKKTWDKLTRKCIAETFAAACTAEGRQVVHPSFAGVLERLFLHCTQGCLDALCFARSASKRIKPQTIRVILGQNYQFKELIALVWWLAVIQEYFVESKITYIYVSRNQKAFESYDLALVLGLCLDHLSRETTVEGEIPDDIHGGKIPVGLMWMGAVKYPGGWRQEIAKRVEGQLKILRVCERGLSRGQEQPCIELSTGHGLNPDSLKSLFDCAVRSIKALMPTDDDQGGIITDACLSAITRFFADGAAVHVLNQIKSTMAVLNNKLEHVQLVSLFSATAPFIETVALHAWARNKGVLPYLLPHSWTSSHEFPAETYINALTFINSKHVMPSVYDDPDSLAKEVVVSHDEIVRLNSVNISATARGIVAKHKALDAFKTMPFCQLWRTVLMHTGNKISSKWNRIIFNRQIIKAGYRLGLLLNNEQYEYQLAIDFNKLFQFIAVIASRASGLSEKNKGLLVLKRKIGWTNIHLLKNYIKKNNRRAYQNMVICPDELGLDGLGKCCDLVLCFQGTSAVPELMRIGVPVVKIKDTSEPVRFEDDYVVLPDDVMPSMNLDAIIAKLKQDTSWCRDLGRVQQNWIRSQMLQ
ncbi:MAG: hypothetical protein HQM16_07800 [Deltaproteobacteria bacterium]|nr:hypothetical protein [Deltaproteobacteria bacterium]